MTSHCARAGKCGPYVTLKNANTHLGHIMKDALRCGGGVSQPANTLGSLAELTNTLQLQSVTAERLMPYIFVTLNATTSVTVTKNA